MYLESVDVRIIGENSDSEFRISAWKKDTESIKSSILIT
jgi:alkyl hydroperoxide reductase subunit AhpC